MHVTYLNLISIYWILCLGDYLHAWHEYESSCYHVSMIYNVTWTKSYTYQHGTPQSRHVMGLAAWFSLKPTLITNELGFSWHWFQIIISVFGYVSTPYTNEVSTEPRNNDNSARFVNVYNWGVLIHVESTK